MTEIGVRKVLDDEAPVLLYDGEPVPRDALVTLSAGLIADLAYVATTAGREAGRDDGVKIGFEAGYAMNGGPVAKRQVVHRDELGQITQIVEEKMLSIERRMTT